ncbi:MAG: hypothetical protein R3B47_04435 [Bacteroidia bacterium]
MNTRCLFASLAFAFIASLSSMHAQIYHHRIGATFLVEMAEDGGFLPLLVYGARFNLTEPGSESAISINVDPGVYFEVYGGTSGNGLTVDFDIPVYLAYDFRGYSTWNSQKYFGGFVGMGMEYFTFPVSSPGPDASSAPMIIGGIRFAIADKNYGLSCSYRLGSKDMSDFLGLRMTWLLGQY